MDEMKKEEILARSRAEGKDEMELEVVKGACRWGLVAFGVIGILLLIFRFIKDVPSDDLMAIVFGQGAGMFIYKYIKLRKWHELFIALIFIVLCVYSIVMYLLSW